MSTSNLIAAVDAAHETGIMHGIRLNETIDYNLLSFVFDTPLFHHEEVLEVPAGPSMTTFYENLGRVVRGEWWLYANSDSRADFCSKCTDQSEYFAMITTLLSYDFFWIHCLISW